jgi:hypothetical protein
MLSARHFCAMKPSVALRTNSRSSARLLHRYGTSVTSEIDVEQLRRDPLPGHPALPHRLYLPLPSVPEAHRQRLQPLGFHLKVHDVSSESRLRPWSPNSSIRNRPVKVMLLLGEVVASAFIPWCALYSEYVEDLSPALQATGWSFFQLIRRT